MTKKYIDYEKLFDIIRFTEADMHEVDINENHTYGFCREAVLEMLDKASVSDVELVKHGKWIEKRRGAKSPEGYYYWNTPLTHVFVCSECGRQENKREPYCNCGAKMDKEEIDNA